MRILRRHLPGHLHPQWREGGHQGGEQPGASSAAELRAATVQGSKTRPRAAQDQVLPQGAALPGDGDGSAGTLAGASLPVLREGLHHQDGSPAGRANVPAGGVRPQSGIPAPRHQAG